jgi:hypothetical protein
MSPRAMWTALRERLAAGKGLVVLHYALEPADAEMAAFLDEAIGGHFQVNWSVNPIWKMKDPLIASTRSPAACGHSRRGGVLLSHPPAEDVIPLLQALPPATSLGADGPRSGNPEIRKELADGKSRRRSPGPWKTPTPAASASPAGISTAIGRMRISANSCSTPSSGPPASRFRKTESSARSPPSPGLSDDRRGHRQGRPRRRETPSRRQSREPEQGRPRTSRPPLEQASCATKRRSPCSSKPAPILTA